MEAKFQRNIKSGSEFNSLFPAAQNKRITVKKYASVEDTLKELKKIVAETTYQTEKVARILKGKTLNETCERIWNFVYWHIQYVKDKDFIEELREPARLWANRGGDCDCFSIMISSILTNLGIPHILRITKYQQPNGAKPFWQHIYPIVPLDGDINGAHEFRYTNPSYITIDCVPDKYDYEVKYLEKKDFPMELHRLAELPDSENVAGLGDLETEAMRGLSELGYSNEKIGILAEISEEEGYTIGSLAEVLGEYDEPELLALQGLLNACECSVGELNELLAVYDPFELVQLSALGELTGDTLCELAALGRDPDDLEDLSALSDLTGHDLGELAAMTDSQVQEVRDVEQWEAVNNTGKVFTNSHNSPNIVDNRIVSPGFVVGIDDKGNKWMLKSISYKFHFSEWVPFDAKLAETWQYQALQGIGDLGKSAKKVAKQVKKQVKKAEKKEKKQVKKAVKKEEKKQFKAERKEYKAKKKEVKKLPKSERKVAKRALKAEKPKTKVGKALQKAAKVVNKLNPGTVLIRNGLLAAMKINMSKVAEKLRFGYLSEAQAQERGMDMDVWKDLKNQVILKERSFEALGGEKKKFKAAILNGKGNKDDKKVLGGLEGDELLYEANMNISMAKDIETLKGLGEPATAATGTAIAAAAATVAKWLSDLNKTAAAAKAIFPGDKKASDEFNSESGGGSILDLVSEAKQFAPGITVNANDVANAVGQDPDALIQKATGEAVSVIANSSGVTYMPDGKIPAMDVPRAGSESDSPIPQIKNNEVVDTRNQKSENDTPGGGMSTTTKVVIAVTSVLAFAGITTAIVLSGKKKSPSVSGLNGPKKKSPTKTKSKSKKVPCDPVKKEKQPFKKVGVIKL